MGSIDWCGPVMCLAIVKAAVALVNAFGVDLAAGQVAAVSVPAEALLAFVAGSRVAPVDDPEPPLGSLRVRSGGAARWSGR